MSWLLLLHQVPPSPPYFRAKVLRRLNQIGAVSIKNSAYILPELDETKEDFEWLHSEIVAEGGEAWLFRADAVTGISEESLVETFRKPRTEEYSQLLEGSQTLLKSISSDENDVDRRPPEWRRLKRRFDEIRQIDFFAAPGRQEVEEVMQRIEVILGESPKVAGSVDKNALANKAWITRRGVKVDRIASAWLVRRFIDEQAKFAFVDVDRHPPRESQIRFDMFEGEFTHEGDLCTFEVLVSRLRLEDPAIKMVAQIVHDIDLKDGKYQRPETVGVAAAIQGIVARHADDLQRIEEGCHLFDAIYAAFQADKKG